MCDKIIEKYDIAISYLAQDEELAFNIYTELGQNLRVFIYTKHQDELGGKSGIKPLREIFTERTNIIVVLHREKWGQTDWTNTEENAIMDFGLKNRWKGIILVKLDKSQIPEWYPENKIYLDFEQYGFEQIIGVIKARAQEMGSEIKQITSLEKAKILQEKRSFQNKRKQLLQSNEGFQEASKEVQKLFHKLEEICTKITSETDVKFEYKKEHETEYRLVGIKQTDEGSYEFQVLVTWSYHYSNSLTDSKLCVLKVDMGRTIYRKGPLKTEEILFDFDLSPSYVNGWRDKQSNKFNTTDQLAEYIVQIIMDFQLSEV